MRINLFRIRVTALILFASAATCFAQSAGSAKPNQPVAIAGGEAIYENDLLPAVQAQIIKLRNQEYELKKKALDGLIEQKLLEAAARKKASTPEKLLQQEVDAKVAEPTDGELRAYYLGQRDNRPFDEIKDQLLSRLKQAKIQEARQDYLKQLRKNAEVKVLLAPPRVQVGYDRARLRGNPKAPVVIVEFADFQCPYCRGVQATLKELLAKYADRVSLAYRDYPLAEIHPEADPAAEAARCAGEQGKFWEYHDQLFSSPKLERPALVEYARNLKLDEKRFDSCLESEKYKADIQRDLQDGTQAGVTGTPAFFINGLPLSGAQPVETFVRVIEEALAQ